ncbi:MAG: hypothetical protein IJ604_03595 [Prevotella sp.]|nr:hypothetical protein [Prevotella sp.]
MENGETSLQDLIRHNGAIDRQTADGYIHQVRRLIDVLHNERHICHLDIRPATIIICNNGLLKLNESSVSQSYSEEGRNIDLRDLKAVNHYLLTGKRHELKPVPPDKEHVTPTATKAKSRIWLIPLSFMIVSVIICFGFILIRKSKTTDESNMPYADFIYNGSARNGQPHGMGTAKYNDGRYYEGRFVKGIREDSNARFVYSDGNIFTGIFSADTIQKGKIVLKSGAFYFIGDFCNGKPFNGFWYDGKNQKKVERVVNGKEIIL